jgi:hypothetical protein
MIAIGFTGTTAGERTSDNGSVVAFAIHPRGKSLAIASTDQVWWQSFDGKPHKLRLAPDGWETKLTFLEDGKLLRLVGRLGDGRGKRTSITWRIEPGDMETVFKEVSREEQKEGQAGEVSAMSPDATRKAVVAGSVVKLLDAKTGEMLKELKAKE